MKTSFWMVLRIAIIGMVSVVTPLLGQQPPPKQILVFSEQPERRTWEFSLETAQMIVVENPNDYYFSTQFLNAAWEPFKPLELGPISMRTQLVGSFIAAAIFSGPESYFLGGGLQLRTIFPLGDSGWSLYAGGGAGMGAADANENDLKDRGLGQDFNFILIGNGGVRYQLSERWAVWAGGLWHHISNADMSEPRKRNTALDGFGAVLGAGYSF